MGDPIEEKVIKWDQNESFEHGFNKYSEINRRIIHLDRWLFSDYEITAASGPNFLKRLNDWLENLNNEADRKVLFELVTHIFYVGREELNVLYREAYYTKFAKWLIDQVKGDLMSPGILSDLNSEAINTWFCPFTDSLRISQFYHVNNIPSTHNLRPQWKSLTQLGDISLINNYISDNGIKRIVLLEDFVGTGAQLSSTVEFLAENFGDIPILIIPLIICPTGVKKLSDICKKKDTIKIDPVIIMPENYLIHKNKSKIESVFFRRVHDLVNKTYSQVNDYGPLDYSNVPYGPYGWQKTGGLVILNTNTPDNTIPLIHHKSSLWNPLFKRHRRV